MVWSFRHWTPRYVINRSLVSWYGWQNPDAPWLTKHAISLLDDWLKPTDIGLEWGSGRSTVWFAKRVARIVSIEHDEDWYSKVKRWLDGQALDNVEYHLVPAADELVGATDHPYVTRPCVGNPSFDFILVDGVMRDHCVTKALTLLKPGGLLVIDNANWYLPHQTHSPNSVGPHGKCPSQLWQEAATQLFSRRHFWTSNGVWDTVFFFLTTDADQ